MRRAVVSIRRRLGPRFAALLAVRLPVDAFLVAGAVLVGARLLDLTPWTLPVLDLHAYWATRDGLDYASSSPFVIGAYLYAPTFAHAIRPLTLLPWPVFAAIWTALILGTYVWLVGRWAFPVLFTIVVALEVYLGQIDVFLAAAIVVGFRYPFAWALPLLTKVTPGVGLVWFVVRREWRKLGIALGATAALAAVGFLLDPVDWRGWFALLWRSATEPQTIAGMYIGIPIWIRLPIAVAIVAWGARTDRPWTVPVAAVLAMPVLWFNTLAVLVAVIPLRREAGRVPARRWLLELRRPSIAWLHAR